MNNEKWGQVDPIALAPYAGAFMQLAKADPRFAVGAICPLLLLLSQFTATAGDRIFLAFAVIVHQLRVAMRRHLD